ncbi:MAG TPA: hypothetical protein VGV61_06405, partial [Thermoanaerobaculia bacterium]|nr:hypothetical protein [Thermoanaerobaculia bacterium]
GQVTTAEGGLTFEQGQRYHIHYVYDAEKGLMSGELSSGGTVLISGSAAATAVGHVLTIPASGLNAEFGHYFGQPGPEVATPGWSYYDLHVEMVPQ